MKKEAVLDPTTFKKIVGSLIYLNATRPGVMFVIDLVNRFMYTLPQLKEYSDT